MMGYSGSNSSEIRAHANEADLAAARKLVSDVLHDNKALRQRIEELETELAAVKLRLGRAA